MGAIIVGAAAGLETTPLAWRRSRIAFRTLRPARACGAGRTLRTRRTNCTGRTGRTGRTGWTSNTRIAFLTLRPSRACRTDRSLKTAAQSQGCKKRNYCHDAHAAPPNEFETDVGSSERGAVVN
jgi:hypothetical protein